MKVISNKWQIYHIAISTLLSLLFMVLVVNDSNYNSYLREGLFAFFSSCIFYWFVVLVVVTVIKSLKLNILSKGWLRLHIVISIFGGVIYSFLYSLFILRFDLYYFYPIIFSWPLIYWIWVLLNYGIKIYNNNLISKKWLSKHFLISLFFSNILILIGEYLNISLENTFFNGVSLFLISYLIFFIFIWIKNGFKESEITNEALNKLKEQKELLDLEIITQEEYDKSIDSLKSMIKK